VISAVGHEPDVTISDFVADLRAATPSNAAELAVPDREALSQTLDSMANAMATALNRQIRSHQQHLDMLSRSQALQSPTGYFDQKQQQLELLKNRLIAAENQNIACSTQRYVALTAKLDAMSPLKVLTRGYSMAQNGRGEVVRSVSQVAPGDTIGISLSDGKILATVTDKKENVQ
jgi:exodeoxyribonuclease VII large subunit